MADYIKREDAIKVFDPLQRRDWYTPWIVETLEDLPSADVVPVVRCKDCRWRDAEEKHHCIDINRVFDQMDFCSFGERKDDE